MNHFDKFLDIYCDKSFKLREGTYLVQEYESKSEESFFNYLVKQKIKERILESVEASEEKNGYCDSDDCREIQILHPGRRVDNRPARCTKTVIATAGERRCLRKRVFSINEAYCAITNYYACCNKIVDLGILITKVWRPTDLERNTGALLLAQKQGIRTLLILRETNQLFPLKIF